MSEKKDPLKQRLVFIFQSNGTMKRADLQSLFDTRIEEALRGSVDWEVD